MALGIFGASLFYGDGMITPAISVLSAVEGLEVAQPSTKDYIVPIALVVLTVLFVIQRFGTGAVGTLFGPVMLIWFGTIAVLGLRAGDRPPDDPEGAVAELRDPVPGRRLRHARSSPSAPSCSRSPAPRRCTPTWAISAATRSAARGSCSCCRRCCCNYMGQGVAGARATRAPSTTRSTGSSPSGAACRWCCWRRSPPSSRRRPSSPAPSRSPARRCSSATCRASTSATRPRRRSARSTSRP